MYLADRTTTTGRMINAYLQESAELDDHAIHLLFSVNRWEKASVFRSRANARLFESADVGRISAGKQSGKIWRKVRLSSAIDTHSREQPSLRRRYDNKLHLGQSSILTELCVKGLDYEWCKSPDVGLPAPDMTFFLSLSPEEASKRGGFGQERYETSEIQNRVRGVFMRLGKDVGSERWQELDAGRSIEQVEEELLEKAVSVCENTIAEIGEMWR